MIRLLEGTEKPILTVNSHKLLSNEVLTTNVRNASKTVDVQLNTIHANFQQHHLQQ